MRHSGTVHRSEGSARGPVPFSQPNTACDHLAMIYPDKSLTLRLLRSAPTTQALGSTLWQRPEPPVRTSSNMLALSKSVVNQEPQTRLITSNMRAAQSRSLSASKPLATTSPSLHSVATKIFMQAHPFHPVSLNPSVRDHHT